jgi:hypothetical protein
VPSKARLPAIEADCVKTSSSARAFNNWTLLRVRGTTGIHIHSLFRSWQTVLEWQPRLKLHRLNIEEEPMTPNEKKAAGEITALMNNTLGILKHVPANSNLKLIEPLIERIIQIVHGPGTGVC